MVEVDEREFDLPQFTEGLSSARQAEKAGELEVVSDLLAEMLTLWRGPALSDICDGGPALEAEARRLDELYIATV